MYRNHTKNNDKIDLYFMFPMTYVCFSYNHVRCMDSKLY